jgi:anaerobic ribonucleoside-triphosphate reductase activating protein
MDDLRLQIAQIVPCTEAEGPGRRFAVWFQGCPLRCPGCCNPEFLPFAGGESRALRDILRELGNADVEGITLLGGEPLAHAEGAAALAVAVRERGLTIMVFTGYTIEEARALNNAHVDQLLANTDILVDGPYVRALPDTSRRWIGSTNQRIHFLSNRYSADDPCWRERNTLEIRVHGAEISVNGFPARQAVGLWKKPKVRAQSA